MRRLKSKRRVDEQGNSFAAFSKRHGSFNVSGSRAPRTLTISVSSSCRDATRWLRVIQLSVDNEIVTRSGRLPEPLAAFFKGGSEPETTPGHRPGRRIHRRDARTQQQHSDLLSSRITATASYSGGDSTLNVGKEGQRLIAVPPECSARVTTRTPLDLLTSCEVLPWASS